MPQNRVSGDFLAAVRNGLLLGAAIWGLMWVFGARPLPPLPAFLAPHPVVARQGAPVPDLGGETASDDVMRLARWTLASGDHQRLPFAVVDKKGARVYLFDPSGKLRGAAPALLGSARGDHTVPGVGSKPIADVLPEERTTPAGRFVARMGVNTLGEDVVWVDYEAAVSMHRVRATVAKERRLQRLASATPDDNRVSWGCINLPPAFYENVLSAAVKATGAIIYVLPETRPVGEVFGF